MEQKILKVGDTIEFNGRKYRAESEAKETPRRHIELGVVRDEGNWVMFKIVEQTHRGNEFCQQTAPDTFKASNGIELVSVSSPAWEGANRLYCCGFCSNKDNIEIVCTTSEFALISEAVNEYNSTDGKGYEKSWPQNGDGYFYIASRGRIEYTEFTDEPFDTDCKAYGNFFRTEEEAMSAAEKVKALFKELAGRVK